MKTHLSIRNCYRAEKCTELRLCCLRCNYHNYFAFLMEATLSLPGSTLSISTSQWSACLSVINHTGSFLSLKQVEPASYKNTFKGWDLIWERSQNERYVYAQ